MARAWYVQGQKHAFPYGTRLVAGPYEHPGDAYNERARLESAGLYPDAVLRVTTHRGKTLPSADDEEPTVPEYDLKKRSERERFADDLRQRAEAFGATVIVENWDGEPDVTIITPALRASVWCVSCQGEMPIISWFGAAFPLREVPGAWGVTHSRKATSLPTTYADLFDALEIGLCAAVDGSAFDLDRP